MKTTCSHCGNSCTYVKKYNIYVCDTCNAIKYTNSSEISLFKTCAKCMCDMKLSTSKDYYECENCGYVDDL